MRLRNYFQLSVTIKTKAEILQKQLGGFKCLLIDYKSLFFPLLYNSSYSIIHQESILIPRCCLVFHEIYSWINVTLFALHLLRGLFIPIEMLKFALLRRNEKHFPKNNSLELFIANLSD